MNVIDAALYLSEYAKFTNYALYLFHAGILLY